MSARSLPAALMLCAIATTAAAQAEQRPPLEAAMDAHLRFLADDLLEGRAPATRGGRLATRYIAAVFQALGLEPAGVDGSYFQPVRLVGMTPPDRREWTGRTSSRSGSSA